MSTNRAAKSGFAAEAQRKVSSRLRSIFPSIGVIWLKFQRVDCDTVVVCYLWSPQLKHKFEPYVMNNECDETLINDNRFFFLEAATRQIPNPSPAWPKPLNPKIMTEYHSNGKNNEECGDVIFLVSKKMNHNRRSLVSPDL
jgi:hypothetical protein